MTLIRIKQRFKLRAKIFILINNAFEAQLFQADARPIPDSRTAMTPMTEPKEPTRPRFLPTHRRRTVDFRLLVHRMPRLRKTCLEANVETRQ